MRRFFERAVWLGIVLIVIGILLVGCAGAPSGAELYALNCAGCHGAAGQGGLATALNSAADLATHDDTTMMRSTREGISNTMMRSFGKANGGTLTDAEIELIIGYVRSVRTTP